VNVIAHQRDQRMTDDPSLRYNIKNQLATSHVRDTTGLNMFIARMVQHLASERRIANGEPSHISTGDLDAIGSPMAVHPPTFGAPTATNNATTTTTGVLLPTTNLTSPSAAGGNTSATTPLVGNDERQLPSDGNTSPANTNEPFSPRVIPPSTSSTTIANMSGVMSSPTMMGSSSTIINNNTITHNNGGPNGGILVRQLQATLTAMSERMARLERQLSASATTSCTCHTASATTTPLPAA
jgi:hypothetical protein